MRFNFNHFVPRWQSNYLFVRDGRTSALIGYTGYVGGNLRAQADFTDFYNTANISELAGKHYDTSCAQARPDSKSAQTT